MYHVLVVEDQAKLRRNLQQLLGQQGYDVTAVDAGPAGAREALHRAFDAIVLDLSLPGRDGMQILGDLRRAGYNTPVLVLTARDSIEDRVAGLDAGADDYLVKPFAHDELLARVRALLRRRSPAQDARLRCGDVDVDLLSRQVTRGGVEIDLTQREFELLEYLLRHKNRTVTRLMLSRDVWKEPQGVLTNVIDVCVNGLRKKIDLPGTIPLITTVRGAGYCIKETA